MDNNTAQNGSINNIMHDDLFAAEILQLLFEFFLFAFCESDSRDNVCRRNAIVSMVQLLIFGDTSVNKSDVVFLT